MGRVLACVMLVACGGGGGGDDDVIDPPGDAGGCQFLFCLPDQCGTLFVAGCEPVDCGQCRYEGATIDPAGGGAAIADDGALISYATATEIRVARRSGSTWTSELVATLDPSASDPTTDIAVSDAGDGTEWVAWSDSSTLAIQVARHAPGAAGWTLEPALGTGVRPRIAVMFEGSPVLAFAGTSPVAIRVRRNVGGNWTLAEIADGAFALALAVDDLNVHVAWRTQDQVARYAVQAIPNDFVVEDIEAVPQVATDAAIGLAISAGTPHVAYSSAESHVTHAVRRAGTWEKRELGHTFGYGGGAAITGGTRPQIGYHDAFSVMLADANGEQTAEQVLSDRCTDGSLDLALDGAGRLGAVYACGGSGGVQWRAQTGERFPPGWYDDCEAVANALFTTACSCAPDPQRPSCCLTDGMGSGNCSGGASVLAIARASVCGDPTRDPAFISTCASAASAAVCTVDGEDGTVVVPAACDP